MITVLTTSVQHPKTKNINEVPVKTTYKPTPQKRDHLMTLPQLLRFEGYSAALKSYFSFFVWNTYGNKIHFTFTLYFFFGHLLGFSLTLALRSLPLGCRLLLRLFLFEWSWTVLSSQLTCLGQTFWTKGGDGRNTINNFSDLRSENIIKKQLRQCEIVKGLFFFFFVGYWENYKTLKSQQDKVFYIMLNNEQW